MDKFLETFSPPKLNLEQTDNLNRLITRNEIESVILKTPYRDFPGGPMIKNSPYNAGDAGLIPDQGTKTPHAMGQLSLCASTREPACRKLQSPCTLEPMCHNYRALKTPHKNY